MPDRVQIRMDVADVRRKLGLTLSGMRAAIALAIKGWLQETIQGAFERESTPEGEKWPPLSATYAARKAGRRVHAIRAKTGKPVSLNLKTMLYLSGDLFRGFAGAQAPGIIVDASHPEVIIVAASSALPYAAAHQYGGRAGRGLRALIPKRSYLPTPRFAERASARVVDEALRDAVSEAGAA